MAQVTDAQADAAIASALALYDAYIQLGQYTSLAELIQVLQGELPLRDIAAHSDIAPGRKTDPGARFDWPRLLASVSRHLQARNN